MTAVLPTPAATPDPVLSSQQERGQTPGKDDSDPGFGPLPAPTRPRPPRPRNPSIPLVYNKLRRKSQGDEPVHVTDYGYRYYDPVTGRWPSRDPLGDKVFFESYLNKEIKGLSDEDAKKKFIELKANTYSNLYLFLKNNAIADVDHLGLVPGLPPCCSRRLCNAACLTLNIECSIVCGVLDSASGGRINLESCWNTCDRAEEVCRSLCNNCLLP